MPEQIAPFAALSDIAKRSKSFAEGLPAQEEVVELWSGIGFTLAGEHFVAPMGEVIEILHLPRVTQIPGVKNWMLGLANVRGRLLPVMDLGHFFNLTKTSMSSRNKRVLVVEHGEVLSGLVVDSVQGMQYFSPAPRLSHPGDPGILVPLLLQGGQWHGPCFVVNIRVHVVNPERLGALNPVLCHLQPDLGVFISQANLLAGCAKANPS